jgi:DNA polymerase delta subunit 1
VPFGPKYSSFVCAPQDTDSIFVSFKDDLRDMHEAFRLGNEASEMITRTFKSPNKLEFEKVYCPLLLIGKKR